MHLQWLDDVLALLEERTLTRAAERRNVTQPAFSRRIRGFEDWLGVSVLDRQSNRVELSPALEANEDEIRALSLRLQELRSKIARFESATVTVPIAAQHAPFCSAFPEMALSAKVSFPKLQFRMRAGNLYDCVSVFLRGDASMLLCYEADTVGRLQFGADVQRGLWGRDYLVPVVGGSLRFQVRDNGEVPEDTPAIVYPESSYFGEMLTKGARAFGTAGFCRNPVSTSAFSSGTRELILKGLGVGWLPFSMIYREIESGALISLVNHYGREPLDVVIFAHSGAEMAAPLMDLWSKT